MKNLKQLLLITSLLSSTFKAHAGLDPCLHKAFKYQCKTHTKIECTYSSRGGVMQKLILQGPPGVDLKSIGSHFQTEKVSLQVNGGEPINFSVKKMTTRINNYVVYSYKHPFFVSDIQITYKDNGNESLIGTWTVDYPPQIQLSCQFGK